ncbi:MAG: hypothetical protein CL930_11900 [Deltaproteobacteria bacterium]|nr:hypothetical protein [Deltaproteobacteria bacterium]
MYKKPALILVFSSFASGYLIYLDRVSPIALHLVELEQRIGIPLPGLLFLVGLTWFGLAWRKAPKRRPQQTTIQRTSGKRTQRDGDTPAVITAEAGTPEWKLQIGASAKRIKLPAGARMEIDSDNKYPIILTIEQAPSERCKRAITMVASWIATIPTPPRLKIKFNQCPEGGVPRHHQVSGAFAQSHSRGHYKVIRHLDEVDVLFSHPDPQWTQ